MSGSPKVSRQSRKKVKHAGWITKGGKQRTVRLYMVWTSMKARCLNQNDKGYDRYGGRGITVCESWLSYMPFREWALQNGYRKGLTIERKDNDGDYCPENCCWIPLGDQTLNTSRTRIIEFNGESMCLSQWAEKIGIDPETLARRLKVWSLEDALTKNKGEKHSYKKLDWEKVRFIREKYRPGRGRFNQSGLAKRFGVDQALISLVLRGLIWREQP